MRADPLAVTTIVARLPAERRTLATLELMREIAPDPLDVREVVGAFGLVDPAPRARERAEVAVAGCLRDPDAGGASMPACASHQLLERLVADAVAACWSARDAFAASVDARCTLSRARTAGEGWRSRRVPTAAVAPGLIARLRARAEAVNAEWARLLLEAHAHVAEAESVAGAVDSFDTTNRWLARTVPRTAVRTPRRPNSVSTTDFALPAES